MSDQPYDHEMDPKNYDISNVAAIHDKVEPSVYHTVSLTNLRARRRDLERRAYREMADLMKGELTQAGVTAVLEKYAYDYAKVLHQIEQMEKDA